MPSVVRRSQLGQGVSRLEVVETACITAGPSLGGGIVQVLTAPFAILLDALSFLVSAAFLAGISGREQPPEVTGRSRLGREMRDGIALVARNGVLRAIAISGALIVGFESAWLGMQPIFLVRDLGLNEIQFGTVLGVTSIGGLLGAAVSGKFTEMFGVARVMSGSVLATVPFMFLMPLADRSSLFLYAIGGAIGGFGFAVFNVAQVTLRQTQCPERMRGRMNATMRFVMWSAIPLGGFAGGLVGELYGLRATLTVCISGMLVAAVPLLSRAVTRLRADGSATA
jgi:predicted MFS family arabinose efflux permease